MSSSGILFEVYLGISKRRDVLECSSMQESMYLRADKTVTLCLLIATERPQSAHACRSLA